MNNKTIEEAAKENCEYNSDSLRQYDKHFIEAFKDGAKWQAERMYGEEDMMACWDACLDFHRIAGFGSGINFNDFIKQFKKK